MSTLAWIGKIGVPVILQSATAPPSIVPSLFRKFGIAHYVTCREQTSRPNTSYQVLRVENPNAAIHKIWQCAMQGTGKMLIFCTSKSDVKHIGTHLGISQCSSDLPPHEVHELLSQLHAGTVRAIVSTPLLGVALDVPDVDLIVHYGCPFDMISYIHETGQAGRGVNSLATAIIVLPLVSHPHRITSPDYMGTTLMHDYIYDRSKCHRWLMGLFNDGLGQTCSMMRGVAHLCDNCQSQSELPPGWVVEIEYTDDMILPYIPHQ